MKHTPGPWSYGKHSRDIYAHGISICRVHPGMLTSFHTPHIETQEANAKLIAAAPDLLEACQAIHELSSVVPVKFQKMIWDIVNPVIKKATE